MKKPNLLLSIMMLLAIATFTVRGYVSTIPAEKVAQSESAILEQIASFSIERMTCAACPVTVSKAMKGIEGVRDVSVDYETKTATVAFNPKLTTIELIGAASTNAGYPSAMISRVSEES